MCSAVYNITSESFISFTDSNSVTITGLSSRSRLNCRSEQTGLHFKNVSAITIKDVIFHHCAFQIIHPDEANYSRYFTASIYIIDSVDINVVNITIQNVIGIGMAFVNCRDINITHSQFYNNYPKNHSNPGGGLFIESSTDSERKSYIYIDDCEFSNNGASLSASDDHFSGNATNFVKGGAISVNFTAETQNVTMTIVNSHFKNNTAVIGGALYISFQNSTHDVTVTV